MPTESPVPNDDPRMIAWNAYKNTEDFQHTRCWTIAAETDENADGVLWSAFIAGMEAATRKHVYWAAGESDCPKDIKAPNGEVHSLRCKVCGTTRPKSFCPGAPKDEQK